MPRSGGLERREGWGVRTLETEFSVRQAKRREMQLGTVPEDLRPPDEPAGEGLPAPPVGAAALAGRLPCRRLDCSELRVVRLCRA